MPLSIPEYLRTANIQDVEIRYLWDDWNVEQAEEPVDTEFLERLTGISQRATIALTIATAEWIVYRFGALCDDPRLLQYLEAAWAQVVHRLHAARTWEDSVAQVDWSGPIKGPLGVAMIRVMYAIQETEVDGNPELFTAWIAKLAPYLMTNPVPYRHWLKRVLERLRALYPRDPDESLGEVVPREALDPGFDFRLDQTEALVNRFLTGLDFESNPFLSSPSWMLAKGFQGTPYVFDIEKERKDRLEW